MIISHCGDADDGMASGAAVVPEEARWSAWNLEGSRAFKRQTKRRGPEIWMSAHAEYTHIYRYTVCTLSPATSGTLTRPNI